MEKSILRAEARAVMGRGVVLHASAILIDGRGWVFAGRSGRGKSTIAWMLEAAGGERIGDDSTILCRGTDSRIRVMPCASFSSAAGKAPEACGLDELTFIEHGPPAIVRGVCAEYAFYRLMTTNALMAYGDVTDIERRGLSKSLESVLTDIQISILRFELRTTPEELRRLLLS